MIKLEKKQGNWLSDNYKLTVDDGYFEILIGGDLDLYWYCYPEEDESFSKTFVITRENDFVYNEFDKLYNNIKNNNPYGSDEELDSYFINHSPYQDGKILWYSDDGEKDKVCNLTIEQEEDSYKVTLNKPEGYDAYSIFSIRFRNSGSRYDPYNIAFMGMYKDMEEYFNKDKEYIKK